MHTARTIVAIVLTVALGVVALVGGLVVALGLGTGLVVAAGVAGVLVARYGLVVQPWHRRWGATDDEASGPLPGDDIVPSAHQTTRAVAVVARPAGVWPWLVQIGWGRAGWYSYDRIDNDGAPSATAIVPAWQDLAVGDRIAMTPDLGFVVRSLDPPRTLVAVSDDGSTSWCLHLTTDGDGSRLVSRFRTAPARGLVARAWGLVADPGAFLMERRMLRGIAARAAVRPVDGAPVSVRRRRHHGPSATGPDGSAVRRARPDLVDAP